MRKKVVKKLFIGSILFMTFGYAVLNTALNIDGKISIKMNNFSIIFKDLIINGIDRTDLISSTKDSFVLSVDDLESESVINYSILNESWEYDAEVSVSCTPKDHDNISVTDKTGSMNIKALASADGEMDASVTANTALLYDTIKVQSKGLDTANGINYNAISSSTNGEGVYETTNTDSGNPVYFYRGNISNNNVIYAGFCWQILRTTETGGIKILYNGVSSNGTCSKPTGDGIGSTTFNPASNDNAYAGYMYGSTGSNLAGTHANNNDSLLKKKIDAWYEANIKNTSYAGMLEDTVWCNDRSIPTNKSNWTSGASNFNQLGYGTNKTLYGFAVRAGSYASVTSPTLKCANASDRFTVSTSKGNGKLNYPVATITGDEVVYAGATGGKYNGSSGTSPANSNYFLTNANGSAVWMMTPTLYNSYLQGSVLYGNGAISSYWTNVGTRSMGVRPAVSLSGDVTISEGDGTFAKPYVVGNSTSRAVSNKEMTCSIVAKPIERTEVNPGPTPDISSLYEIVKSSSLGKDTDVGLDYNSISSPTNGEGVYETDVTESKNTVYFYRGDVKNNHVIFANHCWKIVRTTEYGGTKLIYNGKPTADGVCDNMGEAATIGSSIWNDDTSDNAYVGYMTGVAGASSYQLAHNNTGDSTAKKAVDIWYENNLKDTEYEEYLEDLAYCNDRSIVSDFSNMVNISWLPYTKFGTLGYGTNNTMFSGSKRNGVFTTSINPSLICPQANDKLSSTTEVGTGTLKYPIGLLSSDEVVYAGATGGYQSKGDSIINKNFYLYIGEKHFWTMTPQRYDSGNVILQVLGADGYVSNEVSKITGGVFLRPTISLKNSATVISGNGTVNNPYIITNSTSKVPASWQDNGIFSAYYEQAYEKLSELTQEEKIGQLFIVRHNSSTLNDAIPNYHVGGTTFYAVDFTNKTESQVINMTSSLQKASKIPLITAVDEEGGSIVRISSNTNLASEPFKAPKELYDSGGLQLIKEDTVNKSALLRKLGLNMNFAPVVDIAKSTSYIYKRTVGYGPEITAQYATTVVEASKNTGVSYSLKHFPGYGNNADTHGTSSTDETSLEEFWNTHLVPFKEGINSGAEAVMISHNIVAAVDKENPSSLSKPVHDILFNDLHFTGIAITDDLDMEAATNVTNKYTKALLAGNNIMLLSNYSDAMNEIKTSIQNGLISQDEIDRLAFKVLAWKYYKGLL